MNNENKKLQSLSKADKEKIISAYLKMYHGMAGVGLTQNKTVGQAMYQASIQAKSFVGSKKDNSIATEYLRQVNEKYNVSMAKQMMTRPDKDAKLNIPKSHQAEYAKHAASETEQGIADINAILEMFKDCKVTQKRDNAKPVIKTTAQQRAEFPQGAKDAPATHHGPQARTNPLASAGQLPVQNMHKSHDYGAAKPRRAFQNGTVAVQTKGRDFEHIKKLQIALAQQMWYQNHQRVA